MGLAKRISATGKIEIPAEAKKEAELLFMHEIVSLVKEQNIRLNLTT